MIDIAHFKSLRELWSNLLSNVPADDLFRVPEGFNNHIAWNAAHVVVTQQSLCYSLSGLDVRIPKYLVDKYRKGTSAADADPESFAEAMEHLHTTADQLGHDYASGTFQGFTSYATSAGITLESIEQAIAFNNVHEGIHIGYVLALRKALERG